MQCPVCTTERLVMTDRQGIEIDYCPKCRGVWLDRGELDKIIEKSSASGQRIERPDDDDRGQAPPRYQERDERQAPRDGKHYDDDDRRDDYHGGKGRRRKSFLGDLFDFD